MALAQASESPVIRSRYEKVVDFITEAVAAPFFLRCAALFIDYMVMLTIPVAGLLSTKFFGDGTAYAGPGFGSWMLSIIFWLVNFLVFPLLRGQTIGKFLTGITILNQDGTAPGLITIVRRNLLGYLITALTLGGGFLAAAFSTKGRALHDIVAGTVVIRGRKKQIDNG
jgi:uncharacterized RDD family membrane protein YckC